MKTYVHTKLHKQMFTAALFVVAKTLLTSPPMGEKSDMRTMGHVLSNTKERTIGMRNNLEESSENYNE